jgi:hypothetical protein
MDRGASRSGFVYEFEIKEKRPERPDHADDAGPADLDQAELLHQATKVSIFSGAPVSSKMKLDVVVSTTWARNTSARRSASTRFSPLPDLDQRQFART